MRWKIAEAVMVLGLLLTTSMSLAAQAEAAQQPAPAVGTRAQLPVRSITLYAGGLASIERAGELTGDGWMQLELRPSQVDSVLRTLVWHDSSGGAVEALAYRQRDHRGRAIDFARGDSLVDMLKQLRGFRVRVRVQEEIIVGTILGLEQKTTGSGRSKVEHWQLHILSNGALRPLALDQVTSVEPDDAQVREELTRIADSLSETNETQRQSLVIRFKGKDRRTVRLSYVVDAVPGTLSYRLQPGEKNALQAWATLENQSSEDWENVKVTMAAQRPFSLTPTTRPTQPGSAATVDFVRRARRLEYNSVDDPPEETDEADLKQQKASRRVHLRDAIAAAGAGGIHGQLRHELGPLSIPRQSSIAVPLGTFAIEAEPISVYNESTIAGAVLQGVMIRNTSGKYLPRGSVMLQDRGGYAGESRIEEMAPGEQRLLTFGAEPLLLVDTDDDSRSAAVASARIVRGVLQLKQRYAMSTTYSIENADHAQRTLILEHPRRRGWRLVDTAQPFEITEKLYRFKLTIPAGGESTFTVRQQAIEAEAVELLTADSQTLQAYAHDEQMPQDVRRALKRAADLIEQAEEPEPPPAKKPASPRRISAESTRANVEATDPAVAPGHAGSAARVASQAPVEVEGSPELDEMDGHGPAVDPPKLSAHSLSRKLLREQLESINIGG